MTKFDYTPLLPPRVDSKFYSYSLGFLTHDPVSPNEFILFQDSEYRVHHVYTCIIKYSFRSNSYEVEFNGKLLRSKAQVERFLSYFGFASQDSFKRFGLSGYQLVNFVAVLEVKMVLFVELLEYYKKLQIE
jgi:hypothetical protein